MQNRVHTIPPLPYSIGWKKKKATDDAHTEVEQIIPEYKYQAVRIMRITQDCLPHTHIYFW